MEIDYSDYPWYFKSNGVLDVWEAYSRGEGTVVDLVDSCVIFDLPAIYGKNVSSSRCTYSNESKLEDVHGTAMAGLICATPTNLPYFYEPTQKYVVSGVAPEAKIRNEQFATKADSIEKIIIE